MSNALRSVPPLDLLARGEVPELGAVPRRMLAQVIRAERFGEPADAFREEAIEIPELGPRDVLVYVMAAGVNMAILVNAPRPGLRTLADVRAAR